MVIQCERKGKTILAKPIRKLFRNFVDADSWLTTVLQAAARSDGFAFE